MWQREGLRERSPLGLLLSGDDVGPDAGCTASSPSPRRAASQCGAEVSDALLEAMRGLRMADPDLSLEPMLGKGLWMLAKLREQQPDLGAATKEVREALTALKAESEAAKAAAVASPAAEGGVPLETYGTLEAARPACFESLPPDLTEHVARWLASPSDLTSLWRVSWPIHNACSPVAAQLRRLLLRFPRMEHLLTVAGRDGGWQQGMAGSWQRRWPASRQRPYDYDAIFQQQQAADESEYAPAGMLRELPRASQPHHALQVTIEVQLGDELVHWSGSPVHAIFELAVSGEDRLTKPEWAKSDRPQLWTEAPAWWDELNYPTVDADPEHRGWDSLRARVYLTRGVHTVKVLEVDCPEYTEAQWPGEEGALWYGRSLVDRVGPCRHCGDDTHCPHCACMLVYTDYEGHFWLEFEGCGSESNTLSGAEVCGLLNLWPFGQ